MAISGSLLTEGNSNTDTTAYSSASITPTGDALVLAAVCSWEVGGTADIPAVTGNGLTWVQVDTRLFSGNEMRVTVFRAMGSSPTSGAVTFTFGATQQSCVWGITQYTGVDTSGTNGSGAVRNNAVNGGNGTSLTVNYSGGFSDAVNNAVYAAIANETNIALSFTAPSGMTELNDRGTANLPIRVQSGWKLGQETGVTSTNSTGSSQYGGVIAELVAPGAGGGSGGSPDYLMLLGVG